MITEYNALTGEVTRREMTAEERAQMNVETVQSNSDIANIRQQAYRDRSDSLFMAWQKYLEVGDARAEEAKQSWLDEIHRIDAEFPYL